MCRVRPPAPTEVSRVPRLSRPSSGRAPHEETGQVAEDVSDAPAGFAKEQLKSFIERIERLEEEKKALSYDI